MKTGPCVLFGSGYATGKNVINNIFILKEH